MLFVSKNCYFNFEWLSAPLINGLFTKVSFLSSFLLKKMQETSEEKPDMCIPFETHD